MSSTIEITPNVQRLVEAISINQELKMDEMGMIMCTNCPRKYSNRGAFRMHTMKTHRIIPFQTIDDILGISKNKKVALFCPIEGCPKKCYATSKLLIQHFQKVHQEKKLECSTCGSKFSLLRDLKYHESAKCPMKTYENICASRSREHKTIKAQPKRPNTNSQKLSSLVKEKKKLLVFPVNKQCRKYLKKSISVSTQTDNNPMTMAESVSHELSPNPIFKEIRPEIKSNESCIQQRGSEYQMTYFRSTDVQTIYPKTSEFGMITEYPQTSDFGMITDLSHPVSSGNSTGVDQPFFCSCATANQHEWRHCYTQTPTINYITDPEYYSTASTQTYNNCSYLVNIE